MTEIKPFRVLDVRPKGVYVTMEFSLEDLRRLQTFLSGSEVKYNSEEEPEMAKAVEYITNKFYPDLTVFLDEMEREQWR